MQKLFKHVVSQDTSGRNATNTFLAGRGDVLITYESEAINSRLNGQDIQYVIPRQSMLIELPIAVTKSSSNKDKVEPVHPLREGRDRAGSLRAVRLPARSTSPSRRSTPTSTRRAPASSRSTTRRSAAGARPTSSGSTRTRAAWSRSSGASEDRPLASTAHASAAPRRRTARRPSEGATTALSLGFTTAYLSVIVLLPIAALVWASRAERPARVLVGRHGPAGGRRAEAEHRRRADRRGA